MFDRYQPWRSQNMNARSRHILFQGELSDAPGRSESWTEYARYMGDSRWQLTVEGTDFNGLNAGAPIVEQMSTKAIAMWVLERDAEVSKGAGDSDLEDEQLSKRTLGPRAAQLRQIAVAESAAHCVACLDGWVFGTWPAKNRQAAVKVLAVKSLARRAVWKGVYHAVYEVETSLGPAFMYPPDSGQVSRLVMKSEGSMAPGQRVKVTKALLTQIEALKLASR